MALTNGDDGRVHTETRDAPPSHYLLKVESFSLFSTIGIEKYESNEFEAEGYKWKIILASNLSAGSEVNAIFRFFLFDQIRGEYLTVQAIFNISYKHEWMISQFSKLLEESCYSDVFVIGGYKWKLLLYPKGYNYNRDCDLSLFLVFADSQNLTLVHKVKAEFTITLKDLRNNLKHIQNKATFWFGASNPKCGWPAFIPLKDFNDHNKGFLVNNCCVVEAEVKVLAEMHQAASI